MRIYTLKNKNVACVWSLLTNQMFVKYYGVWSVFKLPAKTFIRLSSNLNSNNAWRLNFIIFSAPKHKYFYMTNLFKFFYFVRSLIFNENPLVTGFYILLDLVGLGFRISKITERLFFFELGWASGVYLLVPENIKINVSLKKRKILLFSSNYNCVTNMLASFLHLRKMSPYRIGGFMQNKLIVRIRTGKQR